MNVLAEATDQQKVKKSKDSQKQKLASLIPRIIYQLEKLRFILEKKIFPRDLSLRLFGQTQDLGEMTADEKKLNFVQDNNEHLLLLAYNMLSKLHEKMQQKMQSNRRSMLIRQL